MILHIAIQCLASGRARCAAAEERPNMLQSDFDEITKAAEVLGTHLIATRDPMLSALCCVGAEGYVNFATAIKAGATTRAIEALAQMRTVAVLALIARDEGGIDRPKVGEAAQRASILATDAINLLHAEQQATVPG